MNKVRLLLFGLLFFPLVVFSDDILLIITDETCDCIEKRISIDTDKKDNNIEMKLGLCIMEKASTKKKEIFKSFKLDINKSEDFQQFAGLVGGKLALRCDKFVSLMMDVMSDEDSKLKKSILEKMDENEIELIGKVENFECNDFCKFTIKQGGSLNTVYVLGEFEGIELVNKSKLLIGEKVNINYKEMDIYSVELKGFIEIKVLTSIQLFK